MPESPEHDLAPTPGQTVGPFFGYALPFECGHQLVPPTHPGAVRLHGTVHDGAGDPVPDALLELRQADQDGRAVAREGSLRRDTGVFTGWGRAETDAAGRYSFLTVVPGPVQGRTPFFGLTVLARGLLDRLFTRIYLPGAEDAFLDGLPPGRRETLLAVREEDGSLRYDVHLQGERETVFLSYPGHRR